MMAFLCHYGSYGYTIVLLDLCVAPSSLQAFIDYILITFPDCILVYGDTLGTRSRVSHEDIRDERALTRFSR